MDQAHGACERAVEDEAVLRLRLHRGDGGGGAALQQDRAAQQVLPCENFNELQSCSDGMLQSRCWGKMALKKLDMADGSWPEFVADWKSQCERAHEDFAQYAVGSFDVLSGLATAPEKNAGVYALRLEDAHAAVCQANCTGLPGYDGPVLRVRMILLSPDYDFGSKTVEEYGNVLVGMFMGIFALSEGEMPSRYIKFHLRSPADRNFFAAIGSGLNGSGAFEKVELSGAWLYVTKHK